MFGLSREMASNSSIRSKTDTKGRYISQGLQPGVYRVALVVNGAVKASITNTKTKADQATQLNFDLKPVAASQASAAGKSGKHKVWVPSNTGSHIGGSWVEVDDSGTTNAGALNVKRSSAEALRQEQLSRASKTGFRRGGGAMSSRGQIALTGHCIAPFQDCRSVS